MALNGIDPLLIIHIYDKRLTSLFDFIPFGSVISEMVGFPIPIYLSEYETGIYVENESRSIDISSEIIHDQQKDPVTGKTKKADIIQKGLSSLVTINLLAVQSSPLLTIFLALMDLIMPKVATAEYAITYLRGPTVIFQGQLQHFSSTAGRNDDLLRMDLTLSTAKRFGDTPLNEQGDEIQSTIPSVPKNTGAIPLT